MDRSIERQKSPQFDEELVSLIKSGMFSARVMGHKEMNIGHIGISLDDTRAETLSRTGINREIFTDALPKTLSPDAKPKASEDVRRFLENASSRARYFNAGSVTIDHLLDAMTDPALPILMMFKFTRLNYPIEVRRVPKTENCEAA